ncbi:hypothetical protein FE773_07280 [Caminibacter mediatlanticus TB-2]|uniref:Uncharacterized protein n=1 Tax=Caminibacter mediatlanticus TB-2 TaxID=391592 RepID=A0ABX5V9N1_9BACT|nr:hypothetical protein [Caminibacter mediatlanticus]QCT94997.1 hypothetical protein FE773_07280 [Caminibacter mediatlanticus TB-2]
MKDFYTNKDEEFLKKSDLVIFYNAPIKKLVKDYVVIGGSDEYSKVDIPKTSKKLPLLLARLAYVFEIYDENLKEDMDFEDFVEVILKGIRVKRELQNHNTTLEEVAGVLYLINNSKRVSFIIGDLDEEEYENLMSFIKMFESKAGIFSKNELIDLEFYGI